MARETSVAPGRRKTIERHLARVKAETPLVKAMRALLEENDRLVTELDRLRRAYDELAGLVAQRTREGASHG